MHRLLFLALLLLWGTLAHAATASLTWVASETTGVTAYKIHYGTTTGVYTGVVDVGTSLSGVVGGLTAGTTYYFAVKAYKLSNESAYSNEVNGASAVGTPVSGVVTLTMPQRIHR